MNKSKHSQSVIASGEKGKIPNMIFEGYVYICLAWVIFALGLDIYIIIKNL